MTDMAAELVDIRAYYTYCIDENQKIMICIIYVSSE